MWRAFCARALAESLGRGPRRPKPVTAPTRPHRAERAQAAMRAITIVYTNEVRDA